MNSITEVFDNYIEAVSTKCSELTISTYRNKLDSLRKRLITDDVESLTKGEIQQIFDSLSSSYKAKTLRSMYSVADAAFRMSVSKGQVNSNPFAGVVIGRIEEHSPVLLTKEQSQSLLESLSETPTVYLPAIIAIETGMQRSQVLALTWNDIDFANLMISVNKNVLESKSHKFTDVKQHQNRQVVMSSHLAEILLGVRNYRRSIGVGVSADDYVCLTSTYKALEPTYFNKLFKKAVQSNPDIPLNLRFQDIRWSYIYNELCSGTDIIEVTKKIGHRSCGRTLDCYSKLMSQAA